MITAAVSSNACVVAEKDNALIGFAIISYTFFGFGFVDLLMVAEKYRRLGVGSALLDYWVENCKTEKLFTSTNESNTPMQNLLTKNGFTFCGKIDGLDEGDPEWFYMVYLR